MPDYTVNVSVCMVHNTLQAQALQPRPQAEWSERSRACLPVFMPRSANTVHYFHLFKDDIDSNKLKFNCAQLRFSQGYNCI